MIDRFAGFFLTEPRRLVVLGRVLLNFSGFLVMAGLFGALATTANSFAIGMSAKAKPVIELADAFPGIPVWWVPESVFGYAFALLCGLLGVFVIRTGRTYQRLH